MFKNNSVKVKDCLKEAAEKWLEEASAEIEAETKRNSRVKTGQTRGSYEHKVDSSELIGYVGSNLQNAIWEEFGTGEYAIHGDGRKGGWFYEDDTGEGHFTYGKTANQPMERAFTSLKEKLKIKCETIVKGKMVD